MYSEKIKDHMEHFLPVSNPLLSHQDGRILRPPRSLTVLASATKAPSQKAVLQRISCCSRGKCRAIVPFHDQFQGPQLWMFLSRLFTTTDCFGRLWSNFRFLGIHSLFDLVSPRSSFWVFFLTLSVYIALCFFNILLPFHHFFLASHTV